MSMKSTFTNNNSSMRMPAMSGAGGMGSMQGSMTFAANINSRDQQKPVDLSAFDTLLPSSNSTKSQPMNSMRQNQVCYGITT